MSGTQIRGPQIRLATLSRGHVDAAFEANLAAIESNIASIFNTMSTDQECLDAIEAITLAWQSADSDLQAAITSLVNATKSGAGLEADGSYVVGESNYLAGSTSLAQAIKALDTALKTAADAASAARPDAVEGNLGSKAMTFARYINRETPAGVVDGANAVFQLAYAPVLGTENVFLNGMLMEPGAGNDYTIDAQGAITLTAVPLVGDRVKVTYFP